MSFELNLIRIATGIPYISLGNPVNNSEEILKIISATDIRGVSILSFPELSLTGVSCGSLFHQDQLYNGQLDALNNIISQTSNSNMLIILGGYFRFNSLYYNCAFAIRRGKLLAIIPKTNQEQSPWFSKWDFCEAKTINFLGSSVTVGSNVILKEEDKELSIGVVIGHDFEFPISQGAFLSENGAEIIINSSSALRLTGEKRRREDLIKSESTKLSCAYVYSSLGAGESTSSALFAGDSLVVENGNLLLKGQSDYQNGHYWISDIDIDILRNTRAQKAKNGLKSRKDNDKILYLPLDPIKRITTLNASFRKYSPTPFLPDTLEGVLSYGMEIFWTQSYSLVRRMESAQLDKIIIGVSGGLDSTLALMVAAMAMDLMNKPNSDIIAVTMPGFGTSNITYNNALSLMQRLGVTSKEIPIGPACMHHFNDIGKNPADRDITYQNAQARERSQILFDLGNMYDGLVLGTGDLSEIALGWSTYNGDHMSNYNVNAGVPKTVIPAVLKYLITLNTFKPLAQTIKSIVDTPISPELLPPDKMGNIVQKTEETIGSYDLHDFFIYFTVKEGAPPEKIFQMAALAFKDIYTKEEVKRCLIIFYKRFFSQQFKRNCSPDSPQVSSISLSYNQFQMASDIDSNMWIEAAESLIIE